MRRILHLITAEPTAIAAEIIEHQKRQSDVQVECFALVDKGVDYNQLLEKIFTADSIHVWSKPR